MSQHKLYFVSNPFPETGEVVPCSQVVICTGTFLSGEVHIGQSFALVVHFPVLTRSSGLNRFPAGRLGEAPSIGLSASLNAAGFKLGRLQTGTPARLDISTIDFGGLERQDGDVVPSPFSFMNRTVANSVRSTLPFHVVKT